MSGTIFALSSAPGRAGVAVVRISGPDAGGALRALSGALPPARVARLASLRDPRDGAPIDRALILWFAAPASATGEDVAELHLHGGRAVVDAAIEALAALPGLRPAEPGEFTRRAFDNGKLDLSEVEGLADLIAAETAAQRRQALRQMSGALSARVEGWRDRTLRALAHLEAEIDFADEDLPADLMTALGSEMAVLRDEIRAALDDGGRGERLRAGLRVAIIGPPNAGKSSLLNAIARRDVAIVSEHAGTTRDVIEVHLDLGGYPVTMVDTAGLRDIEEAPGQSSGQITGQAGIEAEGIRRAAAAAAAADLRLAVFDIRDARDPDRATLRLLDRESLIVLNKADLGCAPGRPKVAGHPSAVISARTGQGLEALMTQLGAAAARRLEVPDEATGITRARHRGALSEAAEALGRACRAGAIELGAEDLRLAGRALGRIAGRIDVEDVLDVIFREFCIGK